MPPIFDVYRRLHILTASLTADILGAKDDIHNRASALETTRPPTPFQNVIYSGLQTA